MYVAVGFSEIRPDLFIVDDTCNVYVLRTGRQGVAIDFGSGAVLAHLDALGIDSITDILMTHHHRDQGQGLGRATGSRIWVPPAESDLFANIDEHWQMRTLDGYYDVRQDRFSVLNDVTVAGSVAEHQNARYGGVDIFTLPTPGHTIGSCSYLVDWHGSLLAFTGDLIYGDGKVWSLSALQWTYNGHAGAAATVMSLDIVGRRRPTMLLPSHGQPIASVQTAIAATTERLEEHIRITQPSGHNARLPFESDDLWDVREAIRKPYEAITPHLLRSRFSFSNEHVLLSDSGTALLFDFGFGVISGYPEWRDRSSRRPWLASIEGLKKEFGVDRVEVAIPTHYHDDHVAGFELLSTVEGTQIWCGDDIASVLGNPHNYDLPCLLHDPIPVHRSIEYGKPFRWREYELSMFPLPGHAKYACATLVEVDGLRVLATGDQQGSSEGNREHLNFQYKNGFQMDDYVKSAVLYQRLRPDLMISGHWLPRRVDSAYLEMLLSEGERLAASHRTLLPLDDIDLGTDGFGALIEPYRSFVPAGAPVTLRVSAKNPFASNAVVAIDLVVPDGWRIDVARQARHVAPRGWTVFDFTIDTPQARKVRRARVAANLTVGGKNLGQHAEALIDLL